MEAYVGPVAMVVTMVFMLVGLPAQIIQNKRTQSAEGLSIVMCVLWLSTFVSRIWYDYVNDDLYIMVPNMLGLSMVAVIFGQVLYYRRRK